MHFIFQNGIVGSNLFTSKVSIRITNSTNFRIARIIKNHRYLFREIL